MLRIQIIFTLTLLLLQSVQSPVQAQSGDLSSEEIEVIIKEAYERFDSGDEEESLELFLKVLNADGENYEALWNTSLIYSRQGFRKESESDQEKYYNKAIEIAERAKELHPDKARSYYVFSVATGRMTDLMGSRDRIRAAHAIQQNIERSIELDPDYAPNWHLYGVWNSDVANVSRGERIAARFISRGLPSGSNEKAEEYLEKAIEITPCRILFRMDLARHYIKIGENEKAVELLEIILEMEPRTKDDPEKLEEAKDLLGKLN